MNIEGTSNEQDSDSTPSTITSIEEDSFGDEKQSFIKPSNATDSKGLQPESECRDDPTFMYKDLEGYDCLYIKANKPEKCQKLHNGVMIGITSCPESCGMVDECLDFNSNGTADAVDETFMEVGSSGPETGSVAEEDESGLSTSSKTTASTSSFEKESVVEGKQSVDLSSNAVDQDATALDQVDYSEMADEQDESTEFENGIQKMEGNNYVANIEDSLVGYSFNGAVNESQDPTISSYTGQNETNTFEGQWEVLDGKADPELTVDVAKQVIENEIESEMKKNSTSLSELKIGDDAVDVTMKYDDKYGYDDDYGGQNVYEYKSNWNNDNEIEESFGSENTQWSANANMYSEPSSVSSI